MKSDSCLGLCLIAELFQLRVSMALTALKPTSDCIGKSAQWALEATAVGAVRYCAVKVTL